MAYKVAIRKNSTGEIRMASMDLDWFKADGGDDMYWWTEGNFACDCNRHLSWERAGGHEPRDDEEMECGSTAFATLYAVLPDGTRIDIDDP